MGSPLPRSRRPARAPPAGAVRGRLAGGCRDEPVEVEPEEVDAGGQRVARRVVIVERRREDLEEPGEGVIGNAHTRDRTSGHRATLDRLCATSPAALPYEYWTRGRISTAPPKRVAGTLAATATAASRSSPSNMK